VDPLAERAYGWTPYRYAYNNPFNFIDPDGQFETRSEARKYRREEGVRGRVRKQEDGSYAIHHRGTNGGVRTFNDSEFGVTTAYVFKAPEQKFSQEGGIPQYGEGGGETQTTAKHTEPFMDPTPLRSFQPGRRTPQSIEDLIMKIAYRLTKIYSIVKQSETNTPSGNSNESAVNPPDDTDAHGQPVNQNSGPEFKVGFYDFEYYTPGVLGGKIKNSGSIWLRNKKDSMDHLKSHPHKKFKKDNE